MNQIHAILAGLAIMAVAGIGLLIVGIRLALRRVWVRAGLVGAAGLVLIAVPTVALLLPARAAPCGGSRTSRCMSNLSQIGKACVMYSMDHNEALPSSFLMLTNYVTNPKLFVCPHSGRRPGTIETVDEWADYVLVTNLTAGSDSDLVLAYCKPENHTERDGVNVLYIDGSVTWATTEMFDQIPCDIRNHSRVSGRPQQTPAGDVLKAAPEE